MMELIIYLSDQFFSLSESIFSYISVTNRITSASFMASSTYCIMLSCNLYAGSILGVLKTLISIFIFANNAHNSVSSSLFFGGYYGKLFSKNLIHQGRFTHIWTSNNINKTSFMRHLIRISLQK